MTEREQFEKWVNENPGYTYLDVWQAARATAPEGMAVVPADALSRVMELAGVALVYQPFGTKDRQHFDTLIAATTGAEK